MDQSICGASMAMIHLGGAYEGDDEKDEVST